MASTKEYRDFILKQLSNIPEIACRPMMGEFLLYSNGPVGEGREDYLIRLCMVVDWCIDHPEYTAKIKVIPKKDYPILMSCEF